MASIGARSTMTRGKALTLPSSAVQFPRVRLDDGKIASLGGARNRHSVRLKSTILPRHPAGAVVAAIRGQRRSRRVFDVRVEGAAQRCGSAVRDGLQCESERLRPGCGPAHPRAAAASVNDRAAAGAARLAAKAGGREASGFVGTR